MRLARAFSFLCLSALLSTASAATSLTPEEVRSAVRTDSLSIPVPGEFFAAMDKHGQPNWTQMLQPFVPASTSSREQMALMLGALVADGYIAVEAQDGQAVKNTGKEIINLAKKLNVNQAILGRGNSINDFATNNDWAALREELEATQNDVKLAMAEQKDQDLVTLVTVGAWIRGVDVASQYISKNQTPELADLLRQPAIVGDLLGRIGNLPEKTRSAPLVVKVHAGLETIRTDVDVPRGSAPSTEQVAELAGVARELVTAIGAPPEKP